MASSKRNKTTFTTGDQRAIEAAKKSSRGAMPIELRELREQNAHQFENIIYKYLNMNAVELRAALADPNAKAVELAIIKIIVKSIESGDCTKLNFLLDRTIGKVKEKLEVETNQNIHALVAKLINE